MATRRRCGVNPDRVAQAAAALEELRDVLAANAPVITQTMNEYWSQGLGTPESLTALQQALGRAADDAADMRARSRLAAIAAATPGNVHESNGVPVVDIPWSRDAVDAADAKAEVQALLAAEANKNPAAARAAIEAIQQDVQDHSDAHDSAFLTDFWSQPQAASAVATLATTLHGQDGDGVKVLSGTDTNILHTFASSLALTCSLPPGQGLSAQQGKAVVAAFTAASQKDPWSAAMLLASGPDGKAYGTGTGAEVLGSVTASLLNAERAGTFTVPMNWQQLLSSGYSMKGEQVNQALARFDPTMALLKVDTSNGAAASCTLAGPDGQAIAHQLMTWQFLQYGNISEDDQGGLTAFHDFSGPQGPWDHYMTQWSQQTIGGFLTAASSTARGDTQQAQWAAQAAVNIVKGVPPATGNGAATLSPQAQQALAQLMTNYRYDLAVSAYTPSQSDRITQFGQTWGISLTSADEQNLIQQALRNPSAFGSFLAQVRGDMGTASVLAVRTQDTEPLDYESALAGLLQRAQNGLHFDTAEQQAAAAAEHQEMAGILQGGLGTVLGFIPGAGLVKAGVDASELANALSGPVVSSSLTSAADPAQAIQDGDNAFYDLKSQIWVPIANALIASHIVTPPPGNQDPTSWVAQQLTQNVTTADQAEVTSLQAELAASSPPARAQLQTQIDKLNAQIGAAANLYDSLLQTARAGIGDQQ